MPYTFYGQGKYLDDDAKAQRMILVGEDGEPPESGGDASAANQETEIAHLAAIEVAVEAIASGEAGDATAAHQVTQNAALAAIQSSTTKRGTAVDRSTTITLGGTAQQLMAVNLLRDYLSIENPDDTDVWYRLTGTAAANGAGSHVLHAGDVAAWEAAVPTNAVSIVGATTAKKVTAEEFP